MNDVRTDVPGKSREQPSRPARRTDGAAHAGCSLNLSCVCMCVHRKGPPPAHNACALYAHVRAEAKAAGAGGLRLYVDNTNARAQKVYAALGMTGDHYRVFEDMFG